MEKLLILRFKNDGTSHQPSYMDDRVRWKQIVQSAKTNLGLQYCEKKNTQASNKLYGSQTLMSLDVRFSKYFSEDDVQTFSWQQIPFHVQAPTDFTFHEVESIIVLSCGGSFKQVRSSDSIFFYIDLYTYYINGKQNKQKKKMTVKFAIKLIVNTCCRYFKSFYVVLQAIRFP